MNPRGPWDIDDFQSMSWHDVHIYGFGLRNFRPDEGCADLIFDIDYILEWQNVDGVLSGFSVCQAELQFEEVVDLTCNLDYSSAAGLCPFSIEGVFREVASFNGHATYRWHMPIAWPKGAFTFTAPRFNQKLIGEPVAGTSQTLPRGG
jgi:hypothetical protein